MRNENDFKFIDDGIDHNHESNAYHFKNGG
jgi:hypothetical protein